MWAQRRPHEAAAGSQGRGRGCNQPRRRLGLGLPASGPARRQVVAAAAQAGALRYGHRSRQRVPQGGTTKNSAGKRGASQAERPRRTTTATEDRAVGAPGAEGGPREPPRCKRADGMVARTAVAGSPTGLHRQEPGGVGEPAGDAHGRRAARVARGGCQPGNRAAPSLLRGETGRAPRRREWAGAEAAVRGARGEPGAPAGQGQERDVSEEGGGRQVPGAPAQVGSRARDRHQPARSRDVLGRSQPGVGQGAGRVYRSWPGDSQCGHWGAALPNWAFRGEECIL